MSSFPRNILAVVDRLVDAVIPPRCLQCGEVVANTGALCAQCFDKISFITSPFCQFCGVPFSDSYLENPDSLTCGACAQNPPAFERARAVIVYNDDSRSLITRFKYADRTDLAPAFARWMTRVGGDLLADADVVMPVPLHRWRLLTRTYNQSAYLARRIAKLSGVPVEYGVLRRVKATPSQGGLSAAARRRNVAAAFAIKKPEAVTGKRVVLVDDVLTTGATLNACARALRQSGAAAVDAIVIGRVPAPGG